MDDTRGIELHDARLESLRHEGSDVILALDAFVHDDRASATCVGQWHVVELRLRGATVHQRAIGDAVVLDGGLQVDGEPFENMVPIAFDRTGNVELSLRGAGLHVVVLARGVEVHVIGPGSGREAG